MTTHTCSDACGCCSGIETTVPRTIDNRPGLDAVAYRIGTHPEFKASLLASLSSSDHPSLRGLRTRDDSDFTIALCDALAVMADTLTFYQERIANEAYLRTATETRSIHELAALIGYCPAPGVAASTHLTFTVEDAPGAPDQAPKTVTIPAGTRVQSVPADGEKPVSFETSVEITGRPEWNALRPRLTEKYPPIKGSIDLVLAGVGHNLRPGDVMLFVGDERANDPASALWVTRVLTKVDTDARANHTRVTWQQPIPAAHPAINTRAFVFRQRAAIFGHSAPDWSGQPDTYKASYLGMETPDQVSRADRGEWPLYNIFAPGTVLDTFGRFVTPKPDDVAKTLDEAVKAALLSQGKDVFGAVAKAAGSAGSTVQQTLQGVVGSVGALLNAAQVAPLALQEVWNETLEPVFGALANLGDDMNTAAENFGDQVANVGDDIVDGVKDIFGI